VKLQTIISLIVGVIGLFRDFFSAKKSREDREAGRAQANAETLAKNADAVSDAMKAEIEADQRHKTMPGDEAFDPDFRRD
jgi:hypothetical protein